METAYNGWHNLNWDNVKAGNIIYLYGHHTMNSLEGFRIPVDGVIIEGIDCIVDGYYSQAYRPITWGLHGRSKVTIKNIKFDRLYFIGDGTQKDITIDGCKFLSDGGAYSYITLRNGNDGWLIQNCEFANCHNGIYGSAYNQWDIGSANNVIIRSNKIHDMSDSDAHGIGVQCCQGWIIEDNEIWNTSSAILFYNQGNSVDMGDHVVRNNYIHDIAGLESGGNGIAIYDIYYGETKDLTYIFENNRIENVIGEGIVFKTRKAHPFYIRGNLIKDAGLNGISFNLVEGELKGEISGNTIINPAGGYIYPDKSFPNLLVKDNIFK